MPKKKAPKDGAGFEVIFDREEDGRWIAEIPQFPGALAYGDTKQGAMRRASGIALRIIADKVEEGRMRISIPQLFGYAMA